VILSTTPVHQNWHDHLYEGRQGILLHYDDSASDVGALEWLTKDPRCGVSYNVLILDNGVAYEIAPLSCRAWHAGVCKPSDPRHGYIDANSAFYGVAVAAKDGEVVTPAQFLSVVEVCRTLAASHGWDLSAEPWRITGHNREAWPRGRKIDPVGSMPSRAVLSVEAVRQRFAIQPPLTPAA
jgi:N-acetyl-anhydromuramyl-L-alanine amidase AmpD